MYGPSKKLTSIMQRCVIAYFLTFVGSAILAICFHWTDQRTVRVLAEVGMRVADRSAFDEPLVMYLAGLFLGFCALVPMLRGQLRGSFGLKSMKELYPWLFIQILLLLTCIWSANIRLILTSAGTYPSLAFYCAFRSVYTSRGSLRGFPVVLPQEQDGDPAKKTGQP